MEKRLKEFTECCICSGLLTDPRMLPCIHTFCRKCLEEARVKFQLQAGDSMPCPICRTLFVIPSVGMTGLRINFFMEQLIDITKTTRNEKKPAFGMCEICIEDSCQESTAVSTATQFCVHCHKNICDRCCRDHRKYDALKCHRLIPAASSLQEDSTVSQSTVYCERHRKEQVKLFCLSCNQVLCMMCFAEEHKLHECSCIEIAGHQFRQVIENNLNEVKNFCKETSEKIKNITETQANFQDQIAIAEQEIIRSAIALKNFVDKNTQSLLDELESVKQTVSKQLETEKEDRNMYMAAADSFLAYSDELISKGSSIEVCQNVNVSQSKIGVLRRCHREYANREIAAIQVFFEATVVEEILNRDNILGSIKASLKSVGYLELPLYSSGPAKSVTKLESNIYVLCNRPNAVFVFCVKKPFCLQKKIELEESSAPYDIASCETSRRLYILDKTDDNLIGKCRCIWKMDKADDHRLTKWLPSILDAPLTISVNPKGCLLIVGRNQATVQLQIYEVDGKLIQCITLPSNIRNPSHCIQTLNGEFIISHQNSHNELWTISRLNSQGQTVLSQFLSKEKREELNFPVHFSLDFDKDLLFVADYSNHRVILFDSNNLNLRQIVLTEKQDGLFHPCRILYDWRQRQLIVGQYYGYLRIFLMQQFEV